MRPQHIAAENLVVASSAASVARRFNEAAAYRCGKRDEAKADKEEAPVLQ